jgi:hypothetical protein
MYKGPITGKKEINGTVFLGISSIAGSPGTAIITMA